jgi:hypothetical protein
MKLVTLVPVVCKTAACAVFAVCAGAALAQDVGGASKAAPARDYSADATLPSFALADTDKDGLLSIAELQAALPDVKIMDENSDGFVNQSEAESAVAGLAFETNGYTGGSSLVSEPEYGLIVSSLDDDDAADGAGIVDDNTDGHEGADAQN